jgi:hypothetical protein
MKISNLVVVSAILSLVSASALAATPSPTPSQSGSPTSGLSVQITSFMPISPDNRTAELCGLVTINSGALPKAGNYVAVTVTADPKFNPGPYTVLADPSGVFCTVIYTQTGTAEASAWLPTDQMKAVSGISKLGLKR